MKDQINDLHAKMKENDFTYEKDKLIYENKIQELEGILKQQKNLQKNLEDDKRYLMKNL